MTEPTEKMTEADIRADERERLAKLAEAAGLKSTELVSVNAGRAFQESWIQIAKWLRSQGGDDE